MQASAIVRTFENMNITADQSAQAWEFAEMVINKQGRNYLFTTLDVFTRKNEAAICFFIQEAITYMSDLPYAEDSYEYKHSIRSVIACVAIAYAIRNFRVS